MKPSITRIILPIILRRRRRKKFLRAVRTVAQPPVHAPSAIIVSWRNCEKVGKDSQYHDIVRAQGWPSGDGRRRPGHHGRKRDEAEGAQNPPLYNEKVVAGFAGSTADALSLFSRFEQKLEEYHGNLSRAVVELAKDWRTDRALRHLEALLLVADAKNTYLLSGNGDVIEPDDGIVAIGSGGPYALAAARALAKHTEMSAKEIVQEAMLIAGQICIFTNDQIALEEI